MGNEPPRKTSSGKNRNMCHARSWYAYILAVFLLGGIAGCSNQVPSGNTLPDYENSVYTVEQYDIPEFYEDAPLYIATTEVDPVFYEWAKPYGASNLPITIFRHNGNCGEENGDFVWFPEFSGEELVNLIVVHRWVDGKMSVYYADQDYVDFLKSLAALTTEEHPLFLLRDEEFTYAFVNESIYAITGYAPHQKLPELCLDEESMQIFTYVFTTV